MTFRIHESAEAASRLQEAEKFLLSHPSGTEQFVIGGTRGAADDFVRRITLTRGGAFGLHRFSFGELVAKLAAPELAAEGKAIASRLGLEAVAARAVFQARDEARLGSWTDVSRHPGFARCLASTLAELRLWDAAAADLPSELETLRGIYQQCLDDAALVDWPRLVALADKALEGDGAAMVRGRPILLLDAPISAPAERVLVESLVRHSGDALMTLPVGDDVTWARLKETGAKKVRVQGEAPKTDLQRLRQHLFDDQHLATAKKEDGSIEVFSAPGENRETVEMARKILTLGSRGVSFDQIAVVLRSPELYSAHLETAFRRARIPCYFARGTKRPDPAGRAFLALLACKVEGLSARRFAEYLSFAQVPELEKDGTPPPATESWVGPTDESFGAAVRAAETARETVPDLSGQFAFDFSAPAAVEVDDPNAIVSGHVVEAETGEDPEAPNWPDLDDFDARSAHLDTLEQSDETPQIAGSLSAPWKWEHYLVEAAVIKGKDRWESRLNGFEHELRLKLHETREDEKESARVRTLKRELQRLGHLRNFALPVIDLLDALGQRSGTDSTGPARVPWGVWLEDLEALAVRVLRKPDHVLEVLAELRPMAEVGPVSIEEVRAVLSDRLSELERRPPDDRYGKVFIGTPEQVRGRTFRIVFVPGLAERLFPQRPREDPLLLDRLRRTIDETLPTKETRAAEERLRLRLAVGAAVDHLVLSWPRIESGEARPRVPSFYALDVVRAARGQLPGFEELERVALRARLSWPAPDHPGFAIDAMEHDLAVLGPLLDRKKAIDGRGRGRYLLELNPHLARSLRTRYARWAGGKWSHWDGMVRATEATKPLLAQQSPKVRPYSVTALQKFATCPYQFFLSAIHRLQPREEAVQLVQMDPLTRGSLIHEIQFETLRAMKRQELLPLSEELESAALSVLDETVDEVAQRYEDNLAPAIDRVWSDEVASIRGDLRIWMSHLVEDAYSWTPVHFELAFGLQNRKGHDSESRRDPIEVSGGWKLRGAIDLVEASVEGNRYRVTDHKTGRDLSREIVYIGGGEILQPVFYSLAVEAMLGAPVHHARLSFCTSKGGFAEHSVPIDDFARLYAGQLMEWIDASIQEGALPPAPRKDACKWCDFRQVCGQHEEARQSRKDAKFLERVQRIREQP